MNWERLQYMYERKTYRIVQRHLKKILGEIPLNNISLSNYQILMYSNITDEKIQAMLVDIYKEVGFDYSRRIKKEINKTTKSVLFTDSFLNDILLFLAGEGGSKIVSIRGTLIEDIIKSIQIKLEENATLVQLQNAIYEIVNKSQQFYKWQALRIARTETTFASGFAAMRTASQYNFELTKQWIAAKDDRTRRDHRIENGQIVDYNDPFIMNDGSEMMYPGDPKGKPAQVINCRCTIGFVPKKDKDGNIIYKK
ncbi:Phage head morphogenesis domain containing protein [uncultured Caudovirales phage]|uniref:Phage head morphogenesis domain containing protein n=1 Tax=uncultured Caudovirales phage TaxID=2100421 RepID=A0A6J5N4D3_9CAUD|nr:Phage head morphogenesis domain containing protein [uncultured Caudovirales phage]